MDTSTRVATRRFAVICILTSLAGCARPTETPLPEPRPAAPGVGVGGGPNANAVSQATDLVERGTPKTTTDISDWLPDELPPRRAPKSPVAPPLPSPESEGVIILAKCRVLPIDDVQVPGAEAGVLASLEARPGMQVVKDSLVGQLDEKQAKATYAAAVAAHAKAQQRAADGTKVRLAESTAKAAKAHYDQALLANRKFAGAVAPAEVRRRKLEWEKGLAAIQQAKQEQAVAGRELEIEAAALEQARLAVERRKVRAPISGVVVEVHKRRGEWVSPGDTIFRIVRLDRLVVTGHVRASRLGPKELAGKSVRLLAPLERGRTETLMAKITFVSPLQLDENLLVTAEVDNRSESGQWLLRPGMHVQLAIDIAAPGDATTAVTQRD